jgi:hypothetical protein
MLETKFGFKGVFLWDETQAIPLPKWKVRRFWYMREGVNEKPL